MGRVGRAAPSSRLHLVRGRGGQQVPQRELLRDVLGPGPVEDVEHAHVLVEGQLRQQLGREQEALRRVGLAGRLHQLLEHLALVVGVHALVDLVHNAEGALRHALQRDEVQDGADGALAAALPARRQHLQLLLLAELHEDLDLVLVKVIVLLQPHLTRKADLAEVDLEGGVDFGHQLLQLRQPARLLLVDARLPRVHDAGRLLQLALQVLDLFHALLVLLQHVGVAARDGVRLRLEFLHLLDQLRDVVCQFRHLGFVRFLLLLVFRHGSLPGGLVSQGLCVLLGIMKVILRALDLRRQVVQPVRHRGVLLLLVALHHGSLLAGQLRRGELEHVVLGGAHERGVLQHQRRQLVQMLGQLALQLGLLRQRLGRRLPLGQLRLRRPHRKARSANLCLGLALRRPYAPHLRVLCRHLVGYLRLERLLLADARVEGRQRLLDRLDPAHQAISLRARGGRVEQARLLDAGDLLAAGGGVVA
mmetsp:Transcript_5573/g.14273  ORF Transcript_5573/g.14273 Transcript_5573/m.14273 type:complete len:475 (+) Transcript_5573:229-1653(+)